MGNPANLVNAGASGRQRQHEEADHFAATVRPVIAELEEAGGLGFVSIAAALNGRGIRTSRGARRYPSTVSTCWRGERTMHPSWLDTAKWG